MIEILTKIRTNITIIVVENKEPYYFIIIYKCKEVPLSLFSYQMLVSIFDSDERSSYYNIRSMVTGKSVELFSYPVHPNEILVDVYRVRKAV